MGRHLSLLQLLIVSLLSIVCYSLTKAQQAEISLLTGFSSNTVVRFVLLEGGGSFCGEGAWHTGAGFSRQVGKNFWLNSGLVYSQHKIKITPEYFPDIEIVSRTETLHLVSIPLEVRLEFLQYLFINGGLNIDFGINNTQNWLDSQTGSGLKVGLGAKLNYKKVIFLINPYLKIYSLPAFNFERYQQHLVESGLSFGIGYVL